MRIISAKTRRIILQINMNLSSIFLGNSFQSDTGQPPIVGRLFRSYVNTCFRAGWEQYWSTCSHHVYAPWSSLFVEYRRHFCFLSCLRFAPRVVSELVAQSEKRDSGDCDISANNIATMFSVFFFYTNTYPNYHIFVVSTVHATENIFWRINFDPRLFLIK